MIVVENGQDVILCEWKLVHGNVRALHIKLVRKQPCFAFLELETLRLVFGDLCLNQWPPVPRTLRHYYLWRYWRLRVLSEVNYLNFLLNRVIFLLCGLVVLLNGIIIVTIRLFQIDFFLALLL